MIDVASGSGVISKSGNGEELHVASKAELRQI
jgi:hypothetical protein